MAYGFAKQSGGGLRIFSESGKGTSVEVKLPLVSKHSSCYASPIAAVTNGNCDQISTLAANIAHRFVHGSVRALMKSSTPLSSAVLRTVATRAACD